MNLLINLLYWLLTPILVAKLIISASLFYFDTDKLEVLHVEDKKSTNMYRFPKFFGENIIKKQPVKESVKVEKFDSLKLKACYLEKNREFIIAIENGKTLFIDLNDEYKGAKLVEINNNSATFLKNGNEINLTLIESKSIKTEVVKKTDIKTKAQDGFVSVKREEFKKYTQNITQALRDIRFQEIREDKKFAGLRLSFIRKGSLFDKMGFKKGDKIRSIDSKNLDSMMDLLPYYNSLNDITTLQIGFKRDNEIKEIIYEIN